jgi:DNA-binding NarL/FixJ family response regulator
VTRRPTVMVADDHQRFREALVAVLELDGFEVVGQAADGADAVALAKQLQPDVVVMDLSMPVRTGWTPPGWSATRCRPRRWWC